MNKGRDSFSKNERRHFEKMLYDMLTSSIIEGKEKQVAATFKSLGHPWAIKIYEILAKASSSKDIHMMQLARELYKLDSGRTNPREELPRYYIVATQRLIKRLKKVGLVEEYEGSIRHRRGGAKVKYIKLRSHS
jgi:DNA-binding transcriptional ArsR family regulator